MSGRRFLRETLVLLAAAAVGAAVSNAFAGPERRLRWISTAPPTAPAAPPAVSAATAATVPSTALTAEAAQGKTYTPHPDKPWVEISGDETASLFARKDVPFLDARRTSVYRDGHIPGSRPFSVWEADIDEKVKRFFEEGHEPTAPIVVYCSGGDCEDSHTLAQKLYLAGFDNALVYKDGFPDWEKRGLPIAKGDKP